MLTRRRLIHTAAASAAFAATPLRYARPQSNPDVVIVGAGLAGFSAAKAVAQAGKTFTLLEARGRTGGRAYTESATFGVPYDQGCAWLHSADINPVTKLAQQLGFETIDEGKVSLWVYLDGKEATKKDYDEFDAAYTKVRAAFDDPGEQGKDIAASQMFTPKTRAEKFAVQRVGPWEAGCDWDQLSTMDVFNQTASGVEWMVPKGLGAVVAAYGKAIPVTLNAPVKMIRWGTRGRIVAEGDFGAVEAKAAIVTVPTAIVAEGRLAFDPALPDRKRTAFERVPMQTLNKITMQFSKNIFGPTANTTTLYLQNGQGPMMDYLIRPFGTELAVCFVGGRHAQEMEKAGDKAAVDWAMSELVKTFGAGVRPALVKGHITKWHSEPYSRGAYSASQPGHNKNRAILAEPIEGRLFFAGEATDPQYSTGVHGAHETGLRAGAAAAAV